jgi:hypothetical protein
MSSAIRKSWQQYKQAFETHLGQYLGRRWTEKAFGLGLGPTLDDMVKKYDATVAAYNKAASFIPAADKGDITAINEVQRKMASAIKHAKEVKPAGDKALQKLNAYQQVLQQAINEFTRRGNVPPAAPDLFRKALGSIQAVRDDVNRGLYSAENVYLKNAQTHQREYAARLKRKPTRV